MTVSYIHHVLGIKVSRAKLFQWILDNPEHEWFNILKEKEERVEEFKEFVKYMNSKENGEEHGIDIEDFDDIASDINGEIVSLLDVNFVNYLDNYQFEDEKFELRVMEITHDVCEDKSINTSELNNIVIGIVTDVIMLNSGGLYEPIDPECILPFTTTSKNCKFYEQREVLEHHPFVEFMGQDLKHYLVQDSCTCCT